MLEFKAEGVVGKDVMKLLSSHLEKKGYGWVKINAMCNDTVC
jgi:hexokinase